VRARTAPRTAAKTARIRQSCLGSAEHAPRSTAAPGPGADLRLTAMPLTSDWRPTIVRSPTTARSMNLYAHKAAINARLDPLVDRLAHAGLLAAAGKWSCFRRRREAGTARSACSARASGCSRRAPAARSPGPHRRDRERCSPRAPGCHVARRWRFASELRFASEPLKSPRALTTRWKPPSGHCEVETGRLAPDPLILASRGHRDAWLSRRCSSAEWRPRQDSNLRPSA